MKQVFQRILSFAIRRRNVAAVSPVSVDRLNQMLEYAKRRNLCGRGTSGGANKWIGQSIEIVSVQRNFTAHASNPNHKRGTILTQHRSVSWTYMPHHLGVYLVDGELEFRASHTGRGPREAMPLATAAADLAEIKRCFDYWYDAFGLPESLDRPIRSPKKFEPSGDAISDIQTYLSDGSVQAFHALFEDDGPVIWVDWREEDDNIIRMAADVLGLDDLTAYFDNDNGGLLINYHGRTHRICYAEQGATDRDTTIIALNSVLQPLHELRLCNASKGSDTLAFMALSATNWLRLEQTYPEACARHFAKIGDSAAIFG